MRKISVSTLVTLDGVIEDPGGMGGFEHGGWANRYFNEEAALRSLERLLACDYFLCGRRTYEMFSKAWPKMSGPYADKLNSIPKLVASTTLAEPLTWNARLVKGDVARELKKIKEEVGRDIPDVWQPHADALVAATRPHRSVGSRWSARSFSERVSGCSATAVRVWS